MFWIYFKMFSLSLCHLIVFICLYLEIQSQSYPIGDIRNCQTTYPRDSSSQLQTINVLPGLGFDNLHNLDVGQVYNVSFSTCQITGDGMYILPDNMYLVPILNSEIDYSAKVTNHFQQWKSCTSPSINAEAGDSFSILSGKFSSEYVDTKVKMVNSNSRFVQVGLRHRFYSVHINPDANLHPSFKSQILDIAVNIQNNNTERARYLSQLLVRDYGTDVITSVLAGASIELNIFVSKYFMENNASSELTISASATAKFYKILGYANLTYKFSSNYNEEESFSESITNSHVTTHGGPPFKLSSDSSYSDWEKAISHNDLAAIDRRGKPLYEAINPSNVPELPNILLAKTIQYISDAVSTYYSTNTHSGCTDPSSPNFDFQANVEDNSCKVSRQAYTFGGVFQLCENPIGQSFDVCGAKSGQQKNPLTGSYSCPTGYKAILLNTGSLTYISTQSRCKKKCWLVFFGCHDECEQIYVNNYATYNAYWCAFPPNETVPSGSGYLFGGVYTSREQNPITNSRLCPTFFYPLRLGTDINICVSNDIGGSEYSVPFGGFDSCKTGNALAASPNEFNEGKYPHQCPSGYSRFFAAIDRGCSINYCTEITAFKKQLPNPAKLPPYEDISELSINVSDTLVLVGPYGSVWVKEENGTWTKYTETEYNNGLQLVDTLQNTNSGTGSKENKAAKIGELVGVIIGTIFCTLIFVVVIGCGVSKYRKRKCSRKHYCKEIHDDFEDGHQLKGELLTN